MLREGPTAVVPCRLLAHALDRMDWYCRCLEDVMDRRPVRGLDEAKMSYDAALGELQGYLTSVSEKENS